MRAKLTDRRVGLAAELEKANRANEEAQTELIKTGNSDAMKASTVAHARFSALREAVATIDETLSAKQQEVEEAKTYEAQESTRIRISEIEREMDQRMSKYRRGRVEAHRVLETILPGASQALMRWTSLRNERNKLTGTQPPLKDRVPQVERLEPFGLLVDQALHLLGVIASQPSRAERHAAMIERNKTAEEASRREEELRARRKQEAEVKRISFFTEQRRVGKEGRTDGRASSVEEGFSKTA